MAKESPASEKEKFEWEWITIIILFCLFANQFTSFKISSHTNKTDILENCVVSYLSISIFFTPGGVKLLKAVKGSKAMKVNQIIPPLLACSVIFS